uniref:Uncharacterized protein n=1 Tax=Caenorhabditis japonica TaxID=281687 RepID=A0A8R1IC79_CAEJA
MSAKLLLLLLAVCAVQLFNVVNGENERSKYVATGSEAKKGFRGMGTHMDEHPEYEIEKGTIIRAKRDVLGPTKVTVNPLSEKRVKGFVKIYMILTGTLVFLCILNIIMFIWLSVTLKKVRKP